MRAFPDATVVHMSETSSGPVALSVRQAAEVTSLGEKAIRELVNKGEIPARRFGTRILIDRAGLEAWFDSLPPVVSLS